MASSSLNLTSRPIAALLTIGNELLSGRTVNTNASFLGRQLTALGFSVAKQCVCPDSIKEISGAMGQINSADLLIVTGGLGPTPDDLTRDAIADYFSVPLKFSPEQFKALRIIYKKLGRNIPVLSKRETYYPANARPLINRFGIALGFWIQDEKRLIVVLPGVPTELQKMFIHDVSPLLKRKFKGLRADKKIVASLVGISEPNIMEKLGKGFFDCPFQFGIYPSEGETQICIRSESQAVLNDLKSKIKKRLDPWIYSWSDLPLALTIGDILTRKKKTVAVAESCTGGSLAHAWTQFAGASRFFRGGATVYDSEAKQAIGVPSSVIKKYGEVSPEVAFELAIQACRFWKSDYGMGVTGIAGPTGGSADKPIGLVYIAVACGGTAQVERHLFWGNREQIQRKSVVKSLEQLWRLLSL
ncbi:MAG TPA: nicotinamide-nucleotide amidohydrolase family protein [Candidatus Omnitrophota bacterium]|nr:nicotinamide-nucleotide amidohydrolase family protein [Candidatus Omnitrophota bacterium]